MQTTTIYSQIKNIPITSIKSRSPKQTLKIIKHIIILSSKNLYIRRWAENIIGKACCDFEKADAILAFVQENTQYIKDPRKWELIQTPPTLLRQIDNNQIPKGDCDCLITLTLSLMESIGIATKLIGASYTPSKKLTHVYGAVNIKKKWYNVEPIKNDAPLGWAFPNPTKLITEVV